MKTNTTNTSVIAAVKNLEVFRSMDNVEINRHKRFEREFRTNRYGQSTDVYREKTEMLADDRIKWFGGVACMGKMPYAAFLLKEFGDERIVNCIKRAPLDCNLIIRFTHVNEELDEEIDVESMLVINGHADKEEEFPEFVYFVYTKTNYR